MFCAKSLSIWPSGSEEDLSMSSSFVLAILLLTPIENSKILYLKNETTSLPRKMCCVKFGWNWPSGSEKKNIKIWMFSNGQTKGQADR